MRLRPTSKKKKKKKKRSELSRTGMRHRISFCRFVLLTSSLGLLSPLARLASSCCHTSSGSSPKEAESQQGPSQQTGAMHPEFVDLWSSQPPVQTPTTLKHAVPRCREHPCSGRASLEAHEKKKTFFHVNPRPVLVSFRVVVSSAQALLPTLFQREPSSGQTRSSARKT